MNISVRIIPNAHTTETVGREGQAWVVRVAAPPIEGRANEELIRFLAKKLDCAKSEIDIKNGLSGRHKCVSVPVASADVDRLLSAP